MSSTPLNKQYNCHVRLLPPLYRSMVLSSPPHTPQLLSLSTNNCVRNFNTFHSHRLPHFSQSISTMSSEADCKEGVVGSNSSLWLATNPSKRWGELFFLFYTPFWVTLCLGIVIPLKLYESFAELEYLVLGFISAVPAVLVPMLFVGKADANIPWKDRYWVKASIWITIFNYVGNYFWTHYFFTVLGASFTFPSWTINDVPYVNFLLTHGYFLFYHAMSNMTLRRLRHAVKGLPRKVQWVIEATWILALAYFIAFLETLSLSNFPYYKFVDRDMMYKVGSLFYAIYFIVSFPMFMRMDERLNDLWDLRRVAVEALGTSMVITIILDLWRIFLGPVVHDTGLKQCIQPGLPWFHGHAL